MKAVVSVVRCSGYDYEKVYDAVGEVVERLGGFSRFIPHGSRVLLKPNLLADARVEEAVTTHPAVVEAVIRHVREAGGKPAAGDSPSVASPDVALKTTGICEVLERTGTLPADFNGSQEVPIKGPSSAGELPIAKGFMESDICINLPKLKETSPWLVEFLRQCLETSLWQWLTSRRGFDRFMRQFEQELALPC